MGTVPASVTEFSRRRKTFAWRGVLPVLLLILSGCLLMVWGLPHDNLTIFAANMTIFFAGIWLVISAKRYYRCPACEKMVVSTKNDGTPKETSFAIDYQPSVCPYCKAALK